MRPDNEKALELAQREIAVFVCDAVNLEDIDISLPEVQKLLDETRVSSHRTSDQQLTINQGNAWRYLFDSIKQKKFTTDPEYACKLHAIAAKEEALEWGVFRSGGVSIAGTKYSPPDYKDLPALFRQMIIKSRLINDIYDRAIFIFLEMSRNQFFYDVNKRMGRFMMNAILLNEGYPAINLPANRQAEFNKLMLQFYTSADMNLMNNFMRSCLDKDFIKTMKRKGKESFEP